MRTRHRWLGRAALLAGLGAAAASVGFAAGARASTGTNWPSLLVATPNPVNIDLAGTNPVTVNVGLDANCPQALVNGHTYSIGANSADAGIATVTDSGGPLNCNSDTANPTAPFTVTGLMCGTTSVTFSPVVNPNGNSNKDVPGIQRKLAQVVVPVTVTNSADTTGNPACKGGVVPPPPGQNPAAPAVANYYLNMSRADGQFVFGKCQADIGGKNWRGTLISDIAHWMPLPESIKDDTSAFPTSADWYLYVESEVNHHCGIAGASNGTFDDWASPVIGTTVDGVYIPGYTP